MSLSNSVTSYKTFSKAYDDLIIERTFVEDVEYYRNSKTRFWENFRRIEALGLKEGARVLDIGGGILSVLLSRLLNFDALVADVNDRARADIEDLGLGFVIYDLFSDAPPPVEGLDLVVLTEVIEHIPQPPYVVLGRISKLLGPGGRLFLTTPNGHRFRNLLYMMLGREVLGIYRYPEPGMALGHQHEYTLKQMRWQAEHAGYAIEAAEYYQDGWKGSSRAAQLAWGMARPVGVIPYLRNSITMTLRWPSSPAGAT